VADILLVQLKASTTQNMR
jgi:hypothetical protein